MLEEWNEWYLRYFKTLELPVIFVRFEDLLFYPFNVSKLICNCVQGTFKNIKTDDSRITNQTYFKSLNFKQQKTLLNNQFTMIDGATKAHGNAKNRSMALQAYNNTYYRYIGFQQSLNIFCFVFFLFSKHVSWFLKNKVCFPKKTKFKK